VERKPGGDYARTKKRTDTGEEIGKGRPRDVGSREEECGEKTTREKGGGGGDN